MTKVKIGDRVRMIRTYDHALKGETGTVIAVLTEKSYHDILVMFDKKDNWKHSGSSPAPDIMVSFIEPYPSKGERNDRCQYVRFSDVEVIDSNIKMIVVVDGVKGIATAKLLTGKRTVATGTAKCAPTDTFKYPKGINLAVQRCIAKAYPEEPITVDPAVVKDVGLTTIL